MGNSRTKKTKRQQNRDSAGTFPKSPFSQALLEARNLIAAGETEKGLATLNQLAAISNSPIRRAKILIAIGESETRLSRHNEAHAAYAKASLYAGQAADTDLTLAAGTGMIRSLLRSLRSEEAKTASVQLLSDLEAAEKEFEEIQNLTPGQLAARGSITVPAQPPRMSVGLTKIATAFMESGLTDEAKSFLLKAIQNSPNGASRARQSLAKLALASDQPALAERYAREALLMGRFQAKTTAAWQLYLDARARQNLVPILEADVFATFKQHATGRIASSSTLSIVRVLRAHGDPTWKSIASEALANPAGDRVITIEVGKLLHADNKLFRSVSPEEIAANALKLLRAKDCSAQEMVAHAKEYVRFSLDANREPEYDLVIRIAGKRFPQVTVFSIRHAMTLGAMMAVKHDRARDWLNTLISDTAEAKQLEAWGRATWALARMESVLEKHAEAAFWYMEVGANPATPPRFRIQAMLRGLKHLGKSGDNSTDIGKLSENIRSILHGTDDFRVLLDAARQLALAGPNFTTLKEEAADRGTALADKASSAAVTPQEQLTVIEYLARKLYWDLGRNLSLLQRWDAMQTEQRAIFHVTGASIWYDYLSITFLALNEASRTTEAELLASDILNANRATPEGYVILGSTYAEWLLVKGEIQKALRFFDWVVKEAPTHRKAAPAHYWLAIKNYKEGRLLEARHYANSVTVCFAGSPSLLSEWSIAQKATLLISILDFRSTGASFLPIDSREIESPLTSDFNLLK